MKKRSKISLFVSIISFVAFILWTVLVSLVEVKSIGPNGSEVGFASLNGFIHNLTGVNLTLYDITDWLGLLPIGIVFMFANIGLVQWVKRRKILKVDYDILILGVFYIIVFSVYLSFEYIVINYRPVLINGYLEASYPSSTTMLVCTVMPTAIMQFEKRIKNKRLGKGVCYSIWLFISFMVIGRFISGVHWFSDIFGGIILSVSLVSLYRCFIFIKK